MTDNDNTTSYGPSMTLLRDRGRLEDVIGRLMARLSDAEASLKAGRPGDLDGLDTQITILIEQVRSLPKEEAKTYIPFLEGLFDSLNNLEQLAEEKSKGTGGQLPEEPKPDYKETETTPTDSDES